MMGLKEDLVVQMLHTNTSLMILLLAQMQLSCSYPACLPLAHNRSHNPNLVKND